MSLRLCRCGHLESDHDHGLDCGYGWDDDPTEEVACDCTEFVLDYEYIP